MNDFSSNSLGRRSFMKKTALAAASVALLTQGFALTDYSSSSGVCGMNGQCQLGETVYIKDGTKFRVWDCTCSVGHSMPQCKSGPNDYINPSKTPVDWTGDLPEAHPSPHICDKAV
jgi:hypothetical protein